MRAGNTQSCGCQRAHNGALKRKQPGESALNTLFMEYIKGAVRRNYSFELTKEEFKKLTSSNCYYCGSPPTKTRYNESKWSGYLYNGVDRYNNNLGYIKDNCVPCCFICNRAKGDLTYVDFCTWIIRLAKKTSAEVELNEVED